MRGRWVVGAVLVSLLLVAVVLARPGSQARDADLARPTSSAPADVAPLPEEVVVPPDELRVDTTVADLVVSTQRVGPLRLGETREALEDAGWPMVEGRDGCTRLPPSRAGEVALSGWVVDGVLASAQLELTDTDGRSVPTDLGFDVGRPVDEATDFQQQLLVVNPAAAVGGEVRTADRLVDGVRVVLSDLGTYGVRFVEVRTAAAAGCRLDATMLDIDTLPTEQAVLGDVIRSVDVTAVGPLPSALGAGLEQLRASAAWPGAGGLAGTGCEQLEQEGDDGRTTLWLRDGTVVAQRFVSAAAGDPPEEGGRFEDVDGILLRRTSTRATVLFAPAPELRSRYLHVAQVVPELDTAVLVVPPTLLEQEVGVTCS